MFLLCIELVIGFEITYIVIPESQEYAELCVNTTEGEIGFGGDDPTAGLTMRVVTMDISATGSMLLYSQPLMYIVFTNVRCPYISLVTPLQAHFSQT